MLNINDIIKIIRNVDDFSRKEKLKSIFENQPELINASDLEGITPLMYAAKMLDIELVSFLIDNGADINQQDKILKTALMHVDYRIDDYKKIVEKLLEKGANPNKINSLNETYLDYLNCHQWHKLFGRSNLQAVVRTMKNYPKYIGKFAINGFNNLQKYEHCKLSFRKKADINLQNKDDETAFSLALIFLPKENTLHKKLFNQQIGEFHSKQGRNELSTFCETDGEIFKYRFSIKKSIDNQYTFVKLIKNKQKVIVAKIFVVDFLDTINSGIRKRNFFELQALQNSGLGINGFYAEKLKGVFW